MTRAALAAICLLLALAACATHPSQHSERIERIDHVIVGVADLDEGIEQIFRHDRRPTDRGR